MKTKYPKLVIEEAKALKKHATKEEIERLNFNTFSPNSISGCIYGQMTGYCHSDRAVELIGKCAKRVYHSEEGEPREAKKLNGSPNKFTNRRNFDMSVQYWSPIEVFVSNDNARLNLDLIRFIKGEVSLNLLTTY